MLINGYRMSECGLDNGESSVSRGRFPIRKRAKKGPRNEGDELNLRQSGSGWGIRGFPSRKMQSRGSPATGPSNRPRDAIAGGIGWAVHSGRGGGAHLQIEIINATVKSKPFAGFCKRDEAFICRKICAKLMDTPPAFFASATPAANGILGLTIGSSPETRKKGERMHAINRLAKQRE